jgi:hypothetical protein
VIAAGAEKILQARQRGHRPGEAVVVSLVGELPVEWLVMADIETSYDWLPVIDLDVWLITDSQQLSKLKSFLWQFKKHRPRSLWVLVDDKDRAFEVVFSIKLETLDRPIEQWEWQIEKTPLLKCEKAAMKLVTAGESA